MSRDGGAFQPQREPGSDWPSALPQVESGRSSPVDSQRLRVASPTNLNRDTLPDRGRPPRAERPRVVLSESQRAVLLDVGRFRIIALPDLANARFEGKKANLDRELRTLKTQGFVRIRVLANGSEGRRLPVITLTRKGQQTIEHTGSVVSGQRFYSGFVKPAEVAHDAAIYRMYQAETNRLAESGARVGRVVLDYEFKQKIYRPLAKANGLPAEERAARKAEIARENDLKVVEGKVLLPDLRIEYETQEGGLRHIDLELATHHYRGSQIRGKAAAGFKIYAAASSSGRLSPALRDPEFAAELFRF